MDKLENGKIKEFIKFDVGNVVMLLEANIVEVGAYIKHLIRIDHKIFSMLKTRFIVYKSCSRKGDIQFFMREYDKAMETYQKGFKHDEKNQVNTYKFTKAKLNIKCQL